MQFKATSPDLTLSGVNIGNSTKIALNLELILVPISLGLGFRARGLANP